MSNMENKDSGRNLKLAKKLKNDEFYTRLEDIESELKHYTSHFENKTVLLNGNDRQGKSQFIEYFLKHFETLKLKELVFVEFNPNGYGRVGRYKGINNLNKTVYENIQYTQLNGTGDFREQEVINILRESDIVVTNPPFSLFREFLNLLIEYDKKFLIIGNLNAVFYKEIFPLIKNNDMWLGYNSSGNLSFIIPDDAPDRQNIKTKDGVRVQKLSNIVWFTNLKYDKMNSLLPMDKTYNTTEYVEYDNYKIIEISRVKLIPKDYFGIMGVPISYLTKHNPEQFEILGSSRWSKSDEVLDTYRGTVDPPENDKKVTINGKEKFARLFIRRIQNSD